MMITNKEFFTKSFGYTIRIAEPKDANKLEKVRFQIDGETENMDRVQGEAYLDESGFKELIYSDTKNERNLFLVVEANDKIIGFARCEGNTLKRKLHIVEFGVCILKEYWGYGIGKNLLKESIHWADNNDIKKMILYVLETNKKAIEMYKRYGFEIEGILKEDKLLSDGKYYNTIIMSRFKISKC